MERRSIWLIVLELSMIPFMAMADMNLDIQDTLIRSICLFEDRLMRFSIGERMLYCLNEQSNELEPVPCVLEQHDPQALSPALANALKADCENDYGTYEAAYLKNAYGPETVFSDGKSLLAINSYTGIVYLFEQVG